MNARETEIYSFGPFVLVPQERRLLQAGVPVPLAAKGFDLLVVLVRNHGRLVAKDRLLEEVWPGVVVEEVNLTVNVSAVRKALGATECGGDWIETVPRHGYRFRGKVKAGIEVPSAGAAGLAPERAARHPKALIRQAQWALVATIAVVGAVLAGRLALEKRGVEFKSVAVLPFVAESRGYDELAEGLVEETINRLAGAKVIRVAPRTSTVRYKDPSVDAQSAGRALGVDAVVRKSVV